MMYKPGDRVVAIRNSKDGVVYVFGHGVYEGDFPYEDVTSTEPLVRGSKAHNDYVEKVLVDESLPLPNPRIRLDSGKIVWGCECWWGGEKGFESEHGGGKSKIVEVDVDEARGERAHGIPDLVRGSTS